MNRDELVSYLDDYLDIKEIEDDSQNGLQVEGPDEVTKVAFAVDGCRAAFEQAVAGKAQLLVVHHGLFWAKPVRLVGPIFRRVQTLIKGGCGLYAGGLIGLLWTATTGVVVRPRPRWLLAAVAVNVIDVAAGLVGFSGLPNWPRFAVALPLGLLCGLYLAVGIVDAVDRGRLGPASATKGDGDPVQ